MRVRALLASRFLGRGLTETLCLADINPQAVDACRRSIKDNALATRANVYQSDNLANIPQSEQWDLVVGNPPWFSVEYAWGQATDLKSRDLDWRIFPPGLLAIADEVIE